ncbi:hypothetical protein V8B97DRAFT_2010371 [Scleroderma yunnanense]
MDVDDPNFFTRLARGGTNTFEDRLRNAPHDDDELPRQRDAPVLADDRDPETPLQQLIRHWMNERHAPDILPTEEDLLSRLLDHIRSQVGFARLTDQHFYHTVLQSLPESQQTLDDEPPFIPSMSKRPLLTYFTGLRVSSVTEPDKTRAVFVYARQNCPPVRLPDGTVLEMQKGHISLTPYSVVEQLVARGEVELV